MSQGFARALAGFLGGQVQENERRAVLAERAKLQAAAELKDRLDRERQARLDAQASGQLEAENRRRDADTARQMAGAGFTPYETGMVDGRDAQTAAALGAQTGPMGGAFAAAREVVAARGAQRAPALAAAQGGYLKTGMSDQERIRQDEREARVSGQQASLAQAAELARERMAADAERAREANSLRRDLAGIAAGNRANASQDKQTARAEQMSVRLRSQYEQSPVVKNAYTIANALSNVQAGAERPDAAGDLSMIFAYMKLLDPNSVVRETEFANAQNAAGVPDRIRNLYNRALKGTRLTPDQRAEFVGQAQKVANNARQQLTQFNTRYRSIAEQQGVDPAMVIYDPFEAVVGASQPATPPAAAPPRRAGETGTQYLARVKGGAR